MKILITGSKGFVGKNLIAELKNKGYTDILEYDVDTEPALLNQYAGKCEFIYHLAGVNRPQEEQEFMTGNYGFTVTLLETLQKYNNKAPILLTSSIQAELDNPYGHSKKAGEDLLKTYATTQGIRTMIYRLPNLFGKWARPNYNSVVATFCHNIANDQEIKINDPKAELRLAYIDDVVNEFIAAIKSKENRNPDGFCYIPKIYETTVGELAEKLGAFKSNRKTLIMPSLLADFDRALYATLLSYFPQDGFSYTLDMKRDDRGWLAEFVKSASFGQIFISKTKPGITRGNHWHHTKVEKFLVIQGQAVIKFRKIDSHELIQYHVNSDKLEVLDIPVGYTHSITNTGDTELITLFWAGETFNAEKPDTYYLEA